MIQKKRNYIFDFDSTLTKVEALDVLAEITLENNPDKDAIIQQIIDITNLGIDGEISFTESLERRIKLLEANKSDLEALIKGLQKQVSKSIESNKMFFEEFSENIYVISCGFKEFIDPIVAAYNIPSERVYANTFTFDENGKIVGFDSENPLSQHNGKIKCLKDMNLDGEIQVIGDGYSDYVTREAGVADKFFAYTENVSREKTTRNADHIAPNLDEFLYINDLPRKISYPKNRIKILLLENVHSDAFKKLTNDGFSVETISKSLSEEELIEKIKDVHVLGIRSKTNVTQKEKEQPTVQDLILEYLTESLLTLRHQVEFFRNDDWLLQQDADKVAILHGVVADKGGRIVDTLIKMERERERQRAEDDTRQLP